MITLRQRIFIIISAVVGVMLALLLLYLFVFNKEKVVQETGGAPSIAGKGALIEGTVPASVGIQTAPSFSVPANQDEIYLRQLARMFVERYASYSNQNDNQHINDVLPIVTKKMAGWLKKQSVVQALNYEGVTTKVIATALLEKTGQNAVVEVEAQQEERQGNTVEIKYRAGAVNLTRLDGEWKVDGFYWE